MGGQGRALGRAGLLNREAPEYGEMASGKNRDPFGTWCAASCAIKNVSGLQIVHIGAEYKNRCPNCGTTRVLHDRVTPVRGEKLRMNALDFLTRETRRKGKKHE